MQRVGCKDCCTAMYRKEVAYKTAIRGVKHDASTPPRPLTPIPLCVVLACLRRAGFNRHEGDATEGPARVVNAVCSDLLDEYSDQVLQVCRGLSSVVINAACCCSARCSADSDVICVQAGIDWLASRGGGAAEQGDAALVPGLDRRLCVVLHQHRSLPTPC